MGGVRQPPTQSDTAGKVPGCKVKPHKKNKRERAAAAETSVVQGQLQSNLLFRALETTQRKRMEEDATKRDRDDRLIKKARSFALKHPAAAPKDSFCLPHATAFVDAVSLDTDVQEHDRRQSIFGHRSRKETS